MQPSMREDYLEAIQLFSEKNARNPCHEELAAALFKPVPVVRSDMADLVASGDVIVAASGVITLTGKGRQTGSSVMKKHETLQCFLSEILGMDSTSASDEACTLEHTVSDETIDRLGRLIGTRGIHCHHGMGRHRKQVADSICGLERDKDCQSQSISEFSEGDVVVIQCIHGRACAQRLLDLGLVPGERATIRRKMSNGALVMQVKGCDVAVSPEIASAIGVERLP
ncbi:MAG: metal-dependent transcriptional regulator [Methanomicrobiales archaeon HGW-Methanomicrobiales-5]|nr:MAG: metal-dependent transcriptional regulator [Methanomicrobiales archaeon HGW-Methanomicrobiales-5]